MSDLIVDSGQLVTTSGAITSVAQTVEAIAGRALQAMSEAASVISDPGVRASVEDASMEARSAYQSVFEGLSTLGRFASSTATSFEKSDQMLAGELTDTLG